MTHGEFELFEIKAKDFMRELAWFAKQNKQTDLYVAERLLHLKGQVEECRDLIAETQEG